MRIAFLPMGTHHAQPLYHGNQKSTEGFTILSTQELKTPVHQDRSPLIQHTQQINRWFGTAQQVRKIGTVQNFQYPSDESSSNEFVLFTLVFTEEGLEISNGLCESKQITTFIPTQQPPQIIERGSWSQKQQSQTRCQKHPHIQWKPFLFFRHHGNKRIRKSIRVEMLFL